MLIYFGYLLFLSLPGKRGRDSGSGEFSLGRSSMLKLSKVGPGVFFAVFGAGLIAYSFAKPMKVNIPGASTSAPTTPSAPTSPGPTNAGTGAVATAGFSYVGAVSAPETDEDRARMRTEIFLSVHSLILSPSFLWSTFKFEKAAGRAQDTRPALQVTARVPALLSSTPVRWRVPSPYSPRAVRSGGSQIRAAGSAS